VCCLERRRLKALARGAIFWHHEAWAYDGTHKGAVARLRDWLDGMGITPDTLSEVSDQ
jgi:hypothetical protein